MGGKRIADQVRRALIAAYKKPKEPYPVVGAVAMLAVFFAGMTLVRFTGQSVISVVVICVTGVVELAIAIRIRRRLTDASKDGG